MSKSFKATGFLASEQHPAFVSIGPTFNCGEISDGPHAHVGVDFYMTPDQALELAYDLIEKAKFAKGGSE